MTIRRSVIAIVSGAIVLALATTATAHHSCAVHDHTRTLTVHGTVTKFQWTNPHAYLERDVKQPDGTVKHYSIELTSIDMMRVGYVCEDNREYADDNGRQRIRVDPGR